MATAKAKQSDIDVLAPEVNSVILESGVQVEIVPLKSRQFFKLIRIATRGAGDAILNLGFDPDDSDSAFATKLVATLAFSIPEAENETIEFVVSMVKPVGLIDRPSSSLNKQDAERNIELWAKVLADLENPELGDLLTIVEAVVTREAGNLKALGKRLGQMLELAKKTGQVPKK